MNQFIDFLINAGRLKSLKRRGWVLRNVKNPESIADHTFRLALMAWLLGQEQGLNSAKLVKMALVHDLCEIYSGDATPYDSFAGKSKQELRQILKSWPRFPKEKKEKIFSRKYQKEKKGLEKLVAKLPLRSRSEIRSLWLDYEKGLTREGRFMRQIDKLENLLQALEYWQKDKDFPIGPWWIQIRELIDNHLLIEFISGLGKKFSKK